MWANTRMGRIVFGHHAQRIRRPRMIGYHWSPQANQESIYKHGLLIPKRHPRLTNVVCCSENHRNNHVSVARTVSQAWSLSIGALVARRQDGEKVKIARLWDLWKCDISGIRYEPIPGWWEIQVKRDIPKSRLTLVGAYFVPADMRYGRTNFETTEVDLAGR